MFLVVRVAIPVPLYRTFDYLPSSGTTVPPVGCRVLVPFGSRRLVGVVCEHSAVSEHSHRLKAIYRSLDKRPTFDERMMALLSWAADYYHHPIGEVFAAALPAGLRSEASPRPPPSDRRFQLTSAGEAASVPESFRRQRELLAALASGPRYEQELRSRFTQIAPVLEALLAKEWIAQVDHLEQHGLELPEVRLSAEQLAAVEAVGDGFAVTLLEGITGSGKTEVYLRLVADVIARGQQALLLVPEIGLTPQLETRLRRRFGERVAVWHSALAEGAKVDLYARSARGEIQAIVGTRSAIFLPFDRLALLVVDEEHDPSLRQQDGFRYSARDLAIKRASMLEVPVVLGSATPSLETLENAYTGRFAHQELSSRASGSLPEWQVVDLGATAQADGLAEPLLTRIGEVLADGLQALVFLNRRGFAPLVLCNACGWQACCANCDARLVLHRARARLKCHHCGQEVREPRSCPACASTDLETLGSGTEQLERALHARFRQYPTLRFDRDAIGSPLAMREALARVVDQSPLLLIGTQMLAKGHDFPKLALVAMVAVDEALLAVDFRATERTAQQIIQVAGRAGRRADMAGEFWLQTRFPDHPLLLALRSGGYPAAAQILRTERREAAFPPFRRLAIVRVEARSEQNAVTAAQRLGHDLQKCAGIQTWGPAPPPLARRAGWHRQQLLLLADAHPPLQRALRSLEPKIQQLRSAQLRAHIDVDPVDAY